jgi:hypothetical protein
MAQEYHPKVEVFAAPKTVAKGQMIAIHATITERYSGEPMVFDNIYMEIIDEKGVPVWPLSLVEVESYTISKLISTADLEAGHTYTVRISPSKHKSPMGVTTFTINHDIIPAALLIGGGLLIPKILLPDDLIEPETPPMKIAWLIYRTERDSKVCPICRPHEGKMFRPNDPKLIKIGPPDKGGDTHYGCRCHYDIITVEDEKSIFDANIEFLIQQQQIYDAYDAFKAAKAAKERKNLRDRSKR